MFGNKPFYLSTTFYGLIIMGLGDVMTWLCGHNVLPGGICSVFGTIFNAIGPILSLLGIRKAVGTVAK